MAEAACNFPTRLKNLQFFTVKMVSINRGREPISTAAQSGRSHSRTGRGGRTAGTVARVGAIDPLARLARVGAVALVKIFRVTYTGANLQLF